eukprot:TRINITY_DN2170_c1_g3_i1.p1 TRINITY_DN2170_c1_g3~~TRINITY_DN2170_c1_g3_i1.p1  ORF type:complete len:562 (-),score=107.64 TRINITY_DN2170_c1_g3_i1:77-1762(-)
MQSEPGAEPGLQAWHARALRGFEQRTESCRALLGELSAVDQLLWALPPAGLETSTSCCESPAPSYLPASSECSAWKSHEAFAAPAIGVSLGAPAGVRKVMQSACTGTTVRLRSLGSYSYARLHLRPGAAQEQRQQQQQQKQQKQKQQKQKPQPASSPRAPPSVLCHAFVGGPQTASLCSSRRVDPREPRDTSGTRNSAGSRVIGTKRNGDIPNRVNSIERLRSAEGVHNLAGSCHGDVRSSSGMARSNSSKRAASSGKCEDREKHKLACASTTRQNTSQALRQTDETHNGRVRSSSEKQANSRKQPCHAGQTPSKKTQAPLAKSLAKREAAKVKPLEQKQQNPAAPSSRRLVNETMREPPQDEATQVSLQGNVGRDEAQQTASLGQDSTAVWSSCELAQKVREELKSLAEVASYAALTCHHTKPLAEVLLRQVSLQLMKLEYVTPQLQCPRTVEETRKQVSDIRDAARQARDTLQDALNTSQPKHSSRDELRDQPLAGHSETSFSLTRSPTNVSTSSVLAAALGDLVLGMRQALDDIHKVRRYSVACDDHGCEYPLSILEE